MANQEVPPVVATEVLEPLSIPGFRSSPTTRPVATLSAASRGTAPDRTLYRAHDRSAAALPCRSVRQPIEK